MINETLPVINKLGLHARAAAKLVTTTQPFSCEISLERKGRRVNAKSIMGVMMLAATCGTTVNISLEGSDEVAALQAIKRLFENRFGEES